MHITCPPPFFPSIFHKELPEGRRWIPEAAGVSRRAQAAESREIWVLSLPWPLKAGQPPLLAYSPHLSDGEAAISPECLMG